MPPNTKTPPWYAMPLSTPPMACSRTPNLRFRPSRAPACQSVNAVRYVLLEGARSAEPPSKVGMTPARALSIFPEAARVAIFSPVAKTGSALLQSVGKPALEGSVPLSGEFGFVVLEGRVYPHPPRPRRGSARGDLAVEVAHPLRHRERTDAQASPGPPWSTRSLRLQAAPRGIRLCPLCAGCRSR